MNLKNAMKDNLKIPEKIICRISVTLWSLYLCVWASFFGILSSIYKTPQMKATLLQHHDKWHFRRCHKKGFVAFFNTVNNLYCCSVWNIQTTLYEKKYKSNSLAQAQRHIYIYIYHVYSKCQYYSDIILTI